MRFQSFDHWEPVPRPYVAVYAGLAAFAARRVGLAKNLDRFMNSVVRSRRQSEADQPRIEAIQMLKQVGISEQLHGDITRLRFD